MKDVNYIVSFHALASQKHRDQFLKAENFGLRTIE